MVRQQGNGKCFGYVGCRELAARDGAGNDDHDLFSLVHEERSPRCRISILIENDEQGLRYNIHKITNGLDIKKQNKNKYKLNKYIMLTIRTNTIKEIQVHLLNNVTIR